MWNVPTKDVLDAIPPLYATESKALKDIDIHLHFFTSSSDWFIAEFDGDDLFFGYAILGGDFINSEWGYISFQEMRDLNVNGFEIDCELNWTVRKASEIEKIRKGGDQCSRN